MLVSGVALQLSRNKIWAAINELAGFGCLRAAACCAVLPTQHKPAGRSLEVDQNPALAVAPTQLQVCAKQLLTLRCCVQERESGGSAEIYRERGNCRSNRRSETRQQLQQHAWSDMSSSLAWSSRLPCRPILALCLGLPSMTDS